MIFPGVDMPARTPAEKARKQKAWAKWVAQENARIARQRRWLDRPGPVRKGLITAMLNRAWELLDAGECEAADALLEFVPHDQAVALLDEFFKD